MLYLTPQERAELDSLLIKPVPDPVDWIESHFWVPEIKGPIVLEPYQKACLREALSRDWDGRFKYSTVIWSDIKKSIKSTLAAAVALWRAVNLDWGQIVIVANDLKQADSRVGYYLRRAVELNPELREQCRVIRYLVELANHTKIESVPIDPSGEAGGNADMVVFSELWGSHLEAQQRMWTEMTTPPNKFGLSQRWVETYAGYTGESVLLERLYEAGVKHGAQFEWANQFDPPLEAFHNDAGRVFCLWNTTPRMPWQTKEYYAQEETVLLPNEFARIHRNQWVSSIDSFVRAEWWDACKGDVPPMVKNELLVVAADASISGDCFGVLAVSRVNGITIPRFVFKYTPPHGGVIEYTPPLGGDPHDLNYPAGAIRWLCDNFNVIQVAYDQYQLHSLMGQLKQDTIAYFRVFPQVMDRLVADKMLQDAIKAREILHDGNPDLREHVINANAKIEGEKIRIVKKSDLRKVDLCVCLSMAHNQAIENGL